MPVPASIKLRQIKENGKRKLMYRRLPVLFSCPQSASLDKSFYHTQPAVEMFKTQNISVLLQSLIELKISFIVPGSNGIAYNCKFAFQRNDFLPEVALNIHCIHWIRCCYNGCGHQEFAESIFSGLAFIFSIPCPTPNTRLGKQIFSAAVFWNIFEVCYRTKYFLLPLLLTGSDFGHSADYSSCLVR